MRKKHKTKIRADCNVCRYHVIDSRWNCYVCKVKNFPGIKFGTYENGKRYSYCHNFEQR